MVCVERRFRVFWLIVLPRTAWSTKGEWNLWDLQAIEEQAPIFIIKVDWENPASWMGIEFRIPFQWSWILIQPISARNLRYGTMVEVGIELFLFISDRCFEIAIRFATLEHGHVCLFCWVAIIWIRMDMPQLKSAISSPTRESSYGKACLSCVKNKSKCVYSNNNSTCDRLVFRFGMYIW